MGENTFPKSKRLLTKRDFFFERGRCVFLVKPSIKSLVSFNKSQKNARLGLSISKKAGNAPLRNRYKRILREHFRTSKLNNLGINFNIMINLSGMNMPDLETQIIKDFQLILDEASLKYENF